MSNQQNNQFQFFKEKLLIEIKVLRIFLFLSRIVLYAVILLHLFILGDFFLSEGFFTLKIEKLLFSFGTIISIILFAIPLLSIFVLKRMYLRRKLKV
jgi:hypothetical protein